MLSGVRLVDAVAPPPTNSPRHALHVRASSTSVMFGCHGRMAPHPHVISPNVARLSFGGAGVGCLSFGTLLHPFSHSAVDVVVRAAVVFAARHMELGTHTAVGYVA